MNASLPTFLRTLLAKELRLLWRHASDLLNPLVFFLVVISLFPLAVSPAPALLQAIAPGVIWVAALLATMMSLPGMFRADYEDGSLEQMLLSPHPLYFMVMGKAAAHWMLTGLPLVIMTPLASLMYHLEQSTVLVMALSVLLGSPCLSLIGALAAALTCRLARGGLVAAILVLPLYLPVLIFATSMVLAASEGHTFVGQVYWLLAIFLLALVLAPLAAAAGLRASVES